MSSLFERIKSAIPSDGLQIAPYKVIRQVQDYEERIYPPQTWVRTSMRNNSREDCTYPMFWKLFNYISGQNGRQLKIPMTAPVSVLVQPDDDQCGGAAAGDLQITFTMAFYIPPPFDQDPPEPNESSVTIEYRPELRIFVRTYGGFTNDRIDQEERCHLLASLTTEDREMVQQSQPGSVHYCAGYDPPLKLFFRRNEIWLPIIQPGLTGVNNQSDGITTILTP
ncbi:heme-binding protein 2-like [Daphnia pulex]|uniref:heme-binding protein 2-like n=1 Tax=Daphnia pulex TaxID=6669 RepID=UPI001EDE4F7F|nr:heme-binding protein 2-like [Daphnia pulex]